MPIYKFQCSRGHVTEDLVPMGTEQVTCEHVNRKGKTCGRPATKRAQTSAARPVVSGGTPIFHRRGN